MIFFNSCNKCPAVAGQRIQIQHLEEELKRVKQYYRQDVDSLNKQIALERKEYEKYNFSVVDNNSVRDIGDPYKFETITTYKSVVNHERGNKRITYYQNYF